MHRSSLPKIGYENTTLADIAKESRVSRGILYYYFSNNEDLVESWRIALKILFKLPLRVLKENCR